MPPKGERIEGYVIRNKDGGIWHPGVFATEREAIAYRNAVVETWRSEGHQDLAKSVSTHPIRKATAVVYAASK